MTLKYRISKALLSLLFYFFTSSICAQQSFNLDWLDLQPEGYALKIKKDSKENVIVLARGDGNPYFHIITLKYNKSGLLLWKRIYVDPLNSFPDVPEDIAIDSLDNIYIAGTVNFDGNQVFLNSRSILLKYDSLGNLKWKREYGSNLNPSLQGEAWSIGIYKNKYIYLAGHVDSVNGNGYWKSFLAQYDSSGVLNWTYIDTNSYYTYASRVLIDNTGNSYLCGTTVCCVPGYNMSVIKFDESGNIKWEKVINEPLHPNSNTKTAIIDDSAYIIVAGEALSPNTGTGYDSYIAKLDSSGALIWTNVLYKDSGVNVYDRVTGIVLDSNQNIYSFGSTGFQAGPYNYLQKVNGLTGAQQWEHWDTYGFSKGVLSGNDNLVFTGETSSGYLLLQSINSGGVINWQYQLLCQCFASDLFESENSFFLAGQNWESFTANEDTIMTCKINLDSMTSILPESEQSFTIFPNPLTNKLNLTDISGNFTSKDLQIYDLFGNIVYSDKITYQVSISTEKWQSGIYFILIKSQESVYWKKIIKLD